MQGWFKLHRKITESAIFSDPDLLRLWLMCLSKATHKETNIVIDRQQITLLPGEFVTGRKSLTEDYNKGLKPRHKKKELSLWRDLKFIEECGNVNIKSTNKYSVVSIVKWVEYQESEQQLNNNRTTDEQQLNTNKNVKNLENNLSTTAAKENPFKLFETEGFGTLSATLGEKIGFLIDDFGERWVCEAMKQATYYGKRNLPYVKSILDRYKSSGVDEPWKEEKGAKENEKPWGGTKGVRPGSDAPKSSSNEGESKFYPSKWADTPLPKVSG